MSFTSDFTFSIFLGMINMDVASQFHVRVDVGLSLHVFHAFYIHINVELFLHAFVHLYGREKTGLLKISFLCMNTPTRTCVLVSN